MSQAPELSFNASRRFVEWLASESVSLAFSTYQAGRLFFVGRDAQGELNIFNRAMPRVMGICIEDNTLWVATKWQLWRFENVLEPQAEWSGRDRWFVPQMGYTTGDVDAHDVALRADRTPVMVCTMLSCLAEPDSRYTVRPLWKPPFISRVAAEDRCHLNGLAMRDGVPRYVTSCSSADVNEGWREHRMSGGIVMDVTTDQVVCDGLSMPHSPRWHQGRLWVHNSGTGEFGYVDLPRGRFEPVAFCPGFLRGASFTGNYAVVGISRARSSKSFEGLPIEETLRTRSASDRCAIQVIDLIRGDVVHELRIEGVVTEIFDTAVLAGSRSAGAVGFIGDEVERTLFLPPG